MRALRKLALKVRIHFMNLRPVGAYPPGRALEPPHQAGVFLFVGQILSKILIIYFGLNR